MTRKLRWNLSVATTLILWAVSAGHLDARPTARGDGPASSRDKRIEKSFTVEGRLVSLAGSSADVQVEARAPPEFS